MSERFGEHVQTKANFVADVVNRTLHDLVIRCTRTEAVRDYYYISVVGYGRVVAPILGGALAGKVHIPISHLADNPVRVESRIKKMPNNEGGIAEQRVRFPVWIDPVSQGWTHMCAGFNVVRELLDDWLLEHSEGFPPTILHLTDGASTDGDPTSIGTDVLSRSTSDGGVLLFNCHISAKHLIRIEYPQNDLRLSDNRARILFNISSQLPDAFRKMAAHFGLMLPAGARAFVYNADPTSVVQFFELGTRPVNLR